MESNKVTIVTSLYDIKRESLDGRSWDSYLNWFRETLKIKCPMVVFVEESIKDLVEESRDGLPTVIITETLDSSSYYPLKERMDEIIGSSQYSDSIRDPGRIECRSSLYNIVQYSKFYWLSRASEIDPFKTDLYLWLDAGISRFFNHLGLKTDLPYPGLSEFTDIDDLSEKMLIQIFMTDYPDLVNADLNTEYLKDNRSYITGGILLGSKKSISLVKLEIDEILNDLMLKKGIVNNEQIAIGYLIKKKPWLFKTFENYSDIHMNYEILNHIK